MNPQLELFPAKKRKQKSKYQFPLPQNAVKIMQIAFMVCEHFNMEFEKLISTTRKREVVKLRQFTMWLCREYITEYRHEETKPIRLKEIGRFFTGKDHETIIHSINATNNRNIYKEDRAEMQEFINKYENQLININND